MAEKRKILIVDDEKQHCENMNELLSLRDYDVNIAVCGKDALNFIRKSFFPVIVLDVKMPDFDGEAILREVLSLHPSSKVVMLSGHGEEINKDRFLALGAHSYLVKPLEFDKFFDMLDTLY